MSREYVHATGISISFDRPILESTDLSIKEEDRIALIGRNGRGKSSFLKVILGLQKPDSGAIYIDPSVRVGYMPQISDLPVGITIEGLLDLPDPRLQVLNEKFADPEIYSSADKMNKLNEEFSRVLASTAQPDKRIFYKMLDKLYFQEEDHSTLIENLSSGQRTKVLLASTLACNPDFLILDEPTNHLDLDSRIWLESYLSAHATSLIVSHDRTFINGVSNRIIELDHNRFTEYFGTYEDYVRQKAEKYRREMAEYDRKVLEVKRLRESAERKGVWVMRGASKLGRTVKHLKRRADKLERKARRPGDTSTHIRFRVDSEETSRGIYSLRGVSKEYDSRIIIQNCDEELFSRDRVALMGPNGAGKTTLLKIILGEIPYEGHIRTGENINIGYYDQEVGKLNDANTILEELTSSRNVSDTKEEARMRSILARMNFTRKSVFKKVGVLSQGERSRVMLAKFIADRVNLLLLDEPTNNLDIPSIDDLIDGLNNFDGSFIAVSHDRYFINSVCNKIWYLLDGELVSFEGNFDDFEEQVRLQ